MKVKITSVIAVLFATALFFVACANNSSNETESTTNPFVGTWVSQSEVYLGDDMGENYLKFVFTENNTGSIYISSDGSTWNYKSIETYTYSGSSITIGNWSGTVSGNILTLNGWTLYKQ